MDWRNHIVSTPDVLQRKLRIKETRIFVSLILGCLAAGKSSEQIIGEFPDVTKEQIPACILRNKITHPLLSATPAGVQVIAKKGDSFGCGLIAPGDI